MLFVEDNTQMQKLFLSTRPKAGFYSFIFTEIIYRSAFAESENIMFLPSRKQYRGPVIDRCLDQRKETCYIISRAIYLQICNFYELK